MSPAVLCEIMRNRRLIYGAGLIWVALLAAPTPAAANCIFDWAVPGRYDISGNFRGQAETVMARLTNDCRVDIALPGVFTGTPLRRDGSCLKFSFKIQDVRQAFTARWCGGYGVVPWQGRNVRATIVRRQGPMNSQSR